MVKRKLKLFFTVILLLFFTSISYANPNADQWQESDKTYKDLINEGFEVKSYAMDNVETANGLYIMLFVTVLQKDNEVYECQEYQTLDNSMQTLDMSLICRELSQPYQRGVGT